MIKNRYTLKKITTFCICAFFFFCTEAFAQNGTLSGVVLDAQSESSLTGATIFIPTLDRGTATDIDGEFQVTDIPAGTYTVNINYVGYRQAQEEVTIEAGETTTLTIQLRIDRLGLDEVVVTGTAGETRQREMGSTVSRVSMDDVHEPISNVDGLLSGRVSGMTVNPGSGTMGAGAAIRLRGNVSATQSNQPLIYIDGVRQGADSYPLNRSEGAGFWQSAQATTSPLNDINPNDIDRIEVIKGASATTLYGSEAAAGVIQIFTKRGREGEPQITIGSNHNFDRVQAFGSDENPYVNMEPFLKTAYSQKHNLSISGGDSDVQYFVSGAGGIDQGIHPNDEGFNFDFRGNFTFRVSPSITVDWNNFYSKKDLEMTHVGNNLYSIQFNAFRAPGNTVGSGDPEVIGRVLDAYIGQEQTRMNSGATIRYVPNEEFTHRLTLGIDRMFMSNSHVTPFGYILQSEGSITEQNWTNESYTIDYAGSFNSNIGSELKNRLSWGGQFIHTEDKLLDAYGRGLPGPGEATVSSASERLSFSEQFRVIDAGLFGETMFDLKDRYFLTVGARVDGNSTFGEDFGFEVYPKVSLSYAISDEDFYPSDFGQLRLRAALGWAGRAPGAFDAVRTFNPISFGGEAAFLPQNVGNPNLGPERTREFEFGFESSPFDEALSVNFTYYNQRTQDALFNVPQIPSQGFTGSQLENVGELKNEGIELELRGQLLEQRNFSLELGTSYSTNVSEVISTGGTTIFNLVEGQPIPVVRGTMVTNRDQVADPQFEREQFFGPSMPTHIFGLDFNMTLPQGIRFSGKAEYNGGHYISQGSQWAMVDRGAGAPGCASVYAQVPHGDYSAGAADANNLTAFQRATCFSENLETGLWIEPADFIKIRNLSLNIPLNFLTSDFVRSAVVSFSASNIRLWTHSEFTGFDPEMVSSREGLTALTTGITETTPAPMSFNTSLRIDF